MPETAVQQVQGGVLHAAVVPVHRRPIAQSFVRNQGLVVMRIHIPEEIPAGTRPLRHGVRFPLGWAAAAGAGGVYPTGHGRQGRFPRFRGFIRFYLRQAQRELILRQGNVAALFAVDNGNGLSPIALAGKYPVPQLKVNLGVAAVFLFHYR